MGNTQRFQKTQKRDFFPHHMLLNAARCEIKEAEEKPEGRAIKCLTAMILSAFSIEALANAVGSRVVHNWAIFERLSPLDKLDRLAKELSITIEPHKEPWSTITQIAKFRNIIAHAKPVPLNTQEKDLTEIALEKKYLDYPKSVLENQITLGNATRFYKALCTLKTILHDKLPEDKGFGINIDIWTGSTNSAE